MVEVKIKSAADQGAKSAAWKRLAKFTGVSARELQEIAVKIAMQKQNELMRSCAKEG